MELKLKNRRVVAIGNSKGFIIPTEYLSQNLDGGINDNNKYDLIIIENPENETEN